MYDEDVFIAAAGEVNHQQLLFSGFSRIIFSACAGMGGLQRRDNPLMAGEFFKGIQRFIIGNRHIIGAANAVQIRMPGPTDGKSSPAEME